MGLHRALYSTLPHRPHLQQEAADNYHPSTSIHNLFSRPRLMGIARILTPLFKVLASRDKRIINWEVVDSKAVEPVHLWDSEDDDDIIFIHDEDVVRTYALDVHDFSDLPSAVIVAQQRLLDEVRSKGYNALWQEGWRLTLLRKAKQQRIEVRYTGRPAYISNPPLKVPPPPFTDVLYYRC